MPVILTVSIPIIDFSEIRLSDDIAGEKPVSKQEE